MCWGNLWWRGRTLALGSDAIPREVSDTIPRRDGIATYRDDSLHYWYYRYTLSISPIDSIIFDNPLFIALYQVFLFMKVYVFILAAKPVEDFLFE